MALQASGPGTPGWYGLSQWSSFKLSLKVRSDPTGPPGTEAQSALNAAQQTCELPS
jgi:hypothetical protein